MPLRKALQLSALAHAVFNIKPAVIASETLGFHLRPASLQLCFVGAHLAFIAFNLSAVSHFEVFAAVRKGAVVCADAVDNVPTTRSAATRQPLMRDMGFSLKLNV